jgi:putative hydrolase of the HAD superfamily
VPDRASVDRPIVDGLLFDAGGVLIVPDPVAVRQQLEPFGVEPSEATCVRAHYAGMAAQAAASMEHDDWPAYRRAVCRACGVPDAHLEAAAAALERLFSPFLWRRPLLESVAALWRLQRAGVPVGIVSNASGQVEAGLRFQGVCQVGPGAGVPVVCVVDSEVVGVAKPDPAAFAPALAALGLPASRVGYVGDSVRNDVGGARAAGMVPFLLDPYDDHPHVDCVRIRSLHDLTAHVRPAMRPV